VGRRVPKHVTNFRIFIFHRLAQGHIGSLEHLAQTETKELMVSV